MRRLVEPPHSFMGAISVRCRRDADHRGDVADAGHPFDEGEFPATRTDK